MKKLTLLLLGVTLILGSLSTSCGPAEAPPTEGSTTAEEPAIAEEPATTEKLATAEEHFDRGITLYEKGQLDEAIGEFTKAIELDAIYAEAYYNRGSAFSKKAKHSNDLADIANASGYYTKADADYTKARADYQKAIADYSKAIKLDPNYTEAYVARGSAFVVIGPHDWAIDDFTKVLELDPNHAWTYFARAGLYLVRFETDKAIADLEKCVEVSQDPSLTQLAKQLLELWR